MIFITGATGLVGSFIAKKFVDNGYKVKCLIRNTSKLTLLKGYESKLEFVEGNLDDILSLDLHTKDIDLFIHCAASVSFSSSNEDSMLKTNVEGTANIVNVCLKNKIRRYIHISSVAALGTKHDDKMIDENTKWEDSKYNSTYGESKYFAELEVWRAFEEGLQGAIVNPSIIIGPGEWDNSSSQLFKYIWNENKFYPQGNINYVDVRDVADAVFNLSLMDTINERYILNGGTLSYKSFFEKVAFYFKKTPPYIKLTPFVSAIAWRLSYLISLFSQRKNVLSQSVAHLSFQKILYNNNKSKQLLPNNYRLIEDSLAWVCPFFIVQSK